MMYYYGPGMGGWGMALMIVGNLVFWGLLIVGAVLVARYIRQGRTASSPLAEVSPQQIAAQRFARGEINEEEYLRLLQVLSGGSPATSSK
jgi:putative membrane protein